MSSLIIMVSSSVCLALLNSWTEPIVLLLIITDAVMLSLQARRALLPAEGGAVPVKGYFHTWEDWVIFVLFVIFTYDLHSLSCAQFGLICSI